MRLLLAFAPALALVIVIAAPGCTSDKAATGATSGADAACPSSSAAAPACSGTVLFGRPNAATGLSDTQCQPQCACQGAAWQAPDYTSADADALDAWKLVTPFPELTSNPYDPPDAAPAPAACVDPNAEADVVCAVVPVATDAAGAHDYQLQTYASSDEAKSHGAIPTHFGACGLCSPLVDLGVYMRYPDLTAPVRACGLEFLSGPMDKHIQCLQALGFDLPCAQIWYYNTINTAAACSVPCFGPNTATYNLPDGSLNPCLQCDEDKSGPVFKAVAGRTRRNTGIASAMCRPCGEVRPLVHAY
jgi:hypothetical protein